MLSRSMRVLVPATMIRLLDNASHRVREPPRRAQAEGLGHAFQDAVGRLADRDGGAQVDATFDVKRAAMHLDETF